MDYGFIHLFIEGHSAVRDGGLEHLLELPHVEGAVAVDVVDLQTNRRFVVVAVLPLADIDEVLGKSGSQLDVRMSANGFMGLKLLDFAHFAFQKKIITINCEMKKCSIDT